MVDFDDYLDQLRAALDVTPKRADEICQEVRSHLNARAGELAATGLSPEDAATRAVGEFGEPKAVAAQLTQANDKYRRANQFGAALGFMVVFAAMFTAPSVGALMTGTILPLAEAQSLFQFLTMLPAAVLAGMVAGRRRWWVAGAAAVLWSTAFVMAVFPVFRDRSSWLPVKLHFIGDVIDVTDVIRTLMWGLVMAGCGYLGSRALGRGMVSWLVGVFCGGYVTLIGLFIPSVMVWSTIQVPGARPGALLIQSVVAFSVVVLGALAYRRWRERMQGWENTTKAVDLVLEQTMGDFDDYLDRLRAALDVTPKRADEICREVQSHLETRVKELMATGLNLEAAAVEAVRGFGEPKHMAAQLTQANSRHRRANRFGAVLGFMIVLVSMFAVSLFWQGPVFALMGTHYSLETLPIHLLTTYAHLPFAEAKSLFGLLVILPAAVFAGMLAGRRRWWVAGIPPVFLSGVLTPLLWLATRNLNPPVNLDLVDIVRRTLVSSLVMAGCGYLGHRVLGRAIVSWLVGAICGGYVALIGLWISSLMLVGVVHGGSSVWSLVILTAGLIVLVLGTLAYRDRRISA